MRAVATRHLPPRSTGIAPPRLLSPDGGSPPRRRIRPIEPDTFGTGSGQALRAPAVNGLVGSTSIDSAQSGHPESRIFGWLPPRPCDLLGRFRSTCGLGRRVLHRKTECKWSLRQAWTRGASGSSPDGHKNAVGKRVIERHGRGSRRKMPAMSHPEARLFRRVACLEIRNATLQRRQT